VSNSTVHLVTGADVALVLDAVAACVDRLVGDGDRGLMLHELSGEDYLVDEVVDAAQTPPFLTERRVVVARGLNRFNAEAIRPLAAYLADPLPTTDLVLEWGGGRIPKSLTDAVAGAGGERTAVGVPSGQRGRQDWLGEQVVGGPVDLDAGARKVILDHLGEDLSRLRGVLSALAAAFGPGSRLSAADVTPFLGGQGAVPPWDLTDAIDEGSIQGALRVLERMLDAGGRHPLQIMASLHGHYERMLRLDGTGVRGEKEAAALLGMKGSTFPARKAMVQLQRLGADGVAQAFDLLVAADLDLRGGSGLDGDAVLEVLVARLARLP